MSNIQPAWSLPLDRDPLERMPIESKRIMYNPPKILGSFKNKFLSIIRVVVSKIPISCASVSLSNDVKWWTSRRNHRSDGAASKQLLWMTSIDLIIVDQLRYRQKQSDGLFRMVFFLFGRLQLVVDVDIRRYAPDSANRAKVPAALGPLFDHDRVTHLHSRLARTNGTSCQLHRPSQGPFPLSSSSSILLLSRSFQSATSRFIHEMLK